MTDDALSEEQNAVAGRSAEEGRLLSDEELRRLVGPTVVAAALHARLRRFAAIYVERRSRDRAGGVPAKPALVEQMEVLLIEMESVESVYLELTAKSAFPPNFDLFSVPSNFIINSSIFF